MPGIAPGRISRHDGRAKTAIRMDLVADFRVQDEWCLLGAAERLRAACRAGASSLRPSKFLVDGSNLRRQVWHVLHCVTEQRPTAPDSMTFTELAMFRQDRFGGTVRTRRDRTPRSSAVQLAGGIIGGKPFISTATFADLFP